MAEAGAKQYRRFVCRTKGCGYEYEAKPIPAYGVSHFCPVKREHVELKGVEEST